MVSTGEKKKKKQWKVVEQLHTGWYENKKTCINTDQPVSQIIQFFYNTVKGAGIKCNINSSQIIQFLQCNEELNVTSTIPPSLEGGKTEHNLMELIFCTCMLR